MWISVWFIGDSISTCTVPKQYSYRSQNSRWYYRVNLQQDQQGLWASNAKVFRSCNRYLKPKRTFWKVYFLSLSTKIIKVRTKRFFYSRNLYLNQTYFLYCKLNEWSVGKLFFYSWNVDLHQTYFLYCKSNEWSGGKLFFQTYFLYCKSNEWSVGKLFFLKQVLLIRIT